MDREEIIRRGQEAQRLLENPLFREAVDGVRKRVIDDILNTLPGEREKREWLYQLHKSVDAVEGLLAAMMTSGVIEAHHLEIDDQPGPDA